MPSSNTPASTSAAASEKEPLQAQPLQFANQREHGSLREAQQQQQQHQDKAADSATASLEASPLGKSSPYVDEYDPSLLFPISRAENRATLSDDVARPVAGVDIWTAYEMSWLNSKGKPVVATATFAVSAESPNIVESKSFKLYLNSFNQSRFSSEEEMAERLRLDLSASTGCAVAIEIHASGACTHTTITELAGELIDEQDITITEYLPQADLLRADTAHTADEVLVSNLLKSNCPVTGQPDWASVQISYAGPKIDRAQLLRYIVSFRQHAGFHEHCVERMFDDIMRMCCPARLTVYARYTRRGGLDINPWRSTETIAPPVNHRTARQ